jgi:hypothetical protein
VFRNLDASEVVPSLVLPTDPVSVALSPVLLTDDGCRNCVFANPCFERFVCVRERGKEGGRERAHKHFVNWNLLRLAFSFMLVLLSFCGFFSPVLCERFELGIFKLSHLKHLVRKT